MKTMALVLLLGLCACGSVSRPGVASGPPSVSPTPLSAADLRYRLIATVGAPVYCDMTQGPVVRTEDPADAARMVAALRAQDPATFDAIVRHEHLQASNLSPADDLRVLGQASMLAAVALTPQGVRYHFAYQVAGPQRAEVAGTIGPDGKVTVASRDTSAPPRLCPLLKQGVAAA